MIAERIPAVQQLTLEEKWLLANELSEQVNEHQQALPTRPEIMAVVEQRLAEYGRIPARRWTWKNSNGASSCREP